MDGFGPKVFAWFKGLERDNTREYFTSTRDFYEDNVRDALEDLLHEIGGDDVKVFRQHRDLRFTKDKSPYKTRTYGIAGRLYVALSAEGMYAGTGYYRLSASSSSATAKRSTRSWPKPWPERSGPGWRSAASSSRPRRAAIRAITRRSTCCGASS